jgi:hypothetical protein
MTFCGCYNSLQVIRDHLSRVSYYYILLLFLCDDALQPKNVKLKLLKLKLVVTSYHITIYPFI